MNKKLLKTLAGITVAGAALGAAFAYVKKCKEVNDLGEEDFDDLWNDEEDDPDLNSCTPSRSYTTIPSDTPVPEPEEEDAVEADDTEDTDSEENADSEEETASEESTNSEEETTSGESTDSADTPDAVAEEKPETPEE